MTDPKATQGPKGTKESGKNDQALADEQQRARRREEQEREREKHREGTPKPPPVKPGSKDPNAA